MTSIRITSNPYRKNIDFQSRKDDTCEWKGINNINNRGSRLISDNIRSSFFPFKVKEIVCNIIDEYQVQGEKIEIVFKGTNDEYDELVDVCKEISEVELKRDEEILENASDILPKIVDIFTEIQPIVASSIKNEEAKTEIIDNTAKFIDASNDVIPVCIIGNYSSGKSTFINALIGMEILPTGDMPITAKVYEIKQAHTPNAAKLYFLCEGSECIVLINNTVYDVQGNADNIVVSEIRKLLAESKDEKLSYKVGRCLEILNKNNEIVSDLVSIEVPFENGELGKTNKSFVIFDTPGSNAATHKSHFEILENAMKNMSNGLPIYVAEYDSLDSCDNENLYKIIKSISQIDDRFTMIVVNKADAANIKEDVDVDTILKQAVPKKLYSGGIYFVSSIMGLGAKTGGIFIDDRADELYEDNERKYSDPSNKRYKSLYKYNIMPEQIKTSIVAASESDNNIVLANSGLVAVEHEIIEFAEKYSAYDKCKQSEDYIEKIIVTTQGEIDEERTVCEATRKQLEIKLEADKKELIKQLEISGGNQCAEIIEAYDAQMTQCMNETKFSFSNSGIKQIERELFTEIEKMHDYNAPANEFKKAKSELADDVAQLGKKNFVEIFTDFKEDLINAAENASSYIEEKIRIDIETAEALIRRITEDYNSRVEEASGKIDSDSRCYWENNTNKVKDALSDIVTNSTTLDDDKKMELSKIIISYGKVEFEDSHIFEKAQFEKKMWLLGRQIELNKINTGKLAKKYNQDYNDCVVRMLNKYKDSHTLSFENWLTQLIDTIRENIVDYSPQLSEKAQQIKEQNRSIEMLEKTKRRLECYSEQIVSAMDWKSLI